MTRALCQKRLSLELHDHRIDGKAVASRSFDLRDRAVLFGAEDVFHLHGFDDRERIASLDLLPHFDGNRLDETGHRAKQELRGIRFHLLGHELRETMRRCRAHDGMDIGTTIGEQITLFGAVELHGDRLTIDLADEDRLTGQPVAGDQMLAGNPTLVVEEGHFETGADGRGLDRLRPIVDLNDQVAFRKARS